MSLEDEFYVGYLHKAPPGIARSIKLILFFFLFMALLFGFAFLMGQSPFVRSVFEFQQYRTFQGRLVMQPYPHLLVQRPGLFGQSPRLSSYLLVAPFKFGAQTIIEESEFANKEVILKGSLIYRRNQSMLELQPGSIRILPAKEKAVASIQRGQKLGKVTLKGEIVDSKCYLGVMKPAVRKIHRSCAVRCISGGIPPLFIVSMPGDRERPFLLVSRQGQAVNHAVLGLVAKPLKISGYVEKKGELLILKADPKDYQILP